MCTYTIIATITKIERAALFFKGVGEYFKKVNDFSRNVLSSRDELKELRLDESCFVLRNTDNPTCDAFYRELFLRSMLDKKPLKFEFEFDAEHIKEVKSVARIDE